MNATEIKALLSSQRFESWFNGKFAPHILGQLHCASDAEIKQDIALLFNIPDATIVKLKLYTTVRDGGTMAYRDTLNNTYFLDNRFNTKTRGVLYNKYPGDPTAEPVMFKYELIDKD